MSSQCSIILESENSVLRTQQQHVGFHCACNLEIVYFVCSLCPHRNCGQPWTTQDLTPCFMSRRRVKQRKAMVFISFLEIRVFLWSVKFVTIRESLCLSPSPKSREIIINSLDNSYYLPLIAISSPPRMFWRWLQLSFSLSTPWCRVLKLPPVVTRPLTKSSLDPDNLQAIIVSLFLSCPKSLKRLCWSSSWNHNYRRYSCNSGLVYLRCVCTSLASSL